MKIKSLICTFAVAASLITPSAHADRSCAWETRIDPAVINTLYPDQFANYWILALPAADGASLSIRGSFPHARYMSFVSYAATLQSADGLSDIAITPDPGSTNPFIAGADRTAINRSYTVTVRYLGVGENPPSPREPNTLYTSNQDGSKAGRFFNVIYRVYHSDQSYANDITGGVGLPSVTYNAPNGTSVPIPTCSYQDFPSNSINQQVANAGGSNSGGGLQHPGFNPPVWHKFQNFVRSLSQGLTENGYWGTTFSDALHPVANAFPTGGFADNPDNNYAFTLLSHGYGQIAVFQATLPTTPDTYPDTAVMPSGSEIRYWSMCSNDGPSERYFGCVMDDGVGPTLDSNGRYTIVVSTVTDEPATVKSGACQCVWLPWGPGGSVVMIMRNMLPDPSFQFSIQKAGYGTEQRDMGSYYPTGCYLSSAAFDAGTRC
ncbi:MAG: hypothetical protein ACYDCC_00485 [Actinomycetota bacterium]